MKPLWTVLLCCAIPSLSGGQIAPASTPRPSLDNVTAITVQFGPIGNVLPISAKDVLIGHPVCSSNGMTLLNVAHQPDFADQSFIGVSLGGVVSTYRVGDAHGLVNAEILGVDAAGSDVYAMVTGEKLDILRKHNIDPSNAKAAFRYSQVFVLHFSSDLQSPDVIPTDLPFHPLRFAVPDRDKITILGFDPVNESPVIAVVDHSGQLVREIDPGNSFGTADQIAGGTRRQQEGGTVPDEGAQVQWALSADQWVHYGDSLLFLLPGPRARVITFSSDGEMESTSLQLPAGLEAMSMVSSDSRWYVRAVPEGAASGNVMNKTILLVINPADGATMQIVHTPELSPINISCIRDGKYYAIHWEGEKDNLKAFLMAGTP